jgi:hypothetical protein
VNVSGARYIPPMLDETWHTTAERLWRSFVTLRQVIEDTAVEDRIDASDALRQFCRHAFELRDWLVNSDIDQAAKDAVNVLFGKRHKDPAKRMRAKSYALAACADIANRTKHYRLTGQSYSEGTYAEIVSEAMSSVGDIPEALRHLIDNVPRFGDHQWHWWIRINGQDHDALMLAEKAIDDWTECLESVGLVQGTPMGWLYLAQRPDKADV